MTSFYPGPSQIYPQVRGFLADAYDSGILSANHRSQAFMDLHAQTLALMHEKLNIPAQYRIFFTSSATECWEVIAQSLIDQHGSTHIYNGAFGKKWHEYTQKIVGDAAKAVVFGLNEKPNNENLNLKSLLCLTQNETSNGSQVDMKELQAIRAQSHGLIAVDATSSMAGVALDWALADVWFASVQKCFGLPAGLGLLVCSPQAMAKAKYLGNNKHYNSLNFIADNSDKNQTAYTPNVLGIYLVYRVLQMIPHISVTAKRIESQARNWYKYFENSPNYELLISNESVQSATVIVVKADAAYIKKLREAAQVHGFTLGKGYGPWAENSFRIANFPAIEVEEIENLKKFLDKFA